MSGSIKLLPDALANKIAAGEVVQRPASVVKELVENALDAEATRVELIIKDAGKSLIQVVDNGKGMNEIDARMCFERHATSKIKNIEDLERISTMGFRGEAMASIGSVAQVTVKTRRQEDEVGTLVEVHGSVFKKHEPCQNEVGTSVSVRNLFYNVPARRKFLKRDTSELSKILDEFNRASLARPNVYFRLVKDGKEVMHLPASTLKQRTINLFGKRLNDQLLPIEQDMEWVKITGFIGKPELAKKKRKEQFLFVNNRYIKSPYLSHAIKAGFDNLIPSDRHPVFFIFLTMSPDKVDVNVHPTKHEVKFDEEQILYNFLRVAIKHTLGKYALTPMIDFDNPDLNLQSSRPSQSSGGHSRQHQDLEEWRKLYQPHEPFPESQVVEKDGKVLIQSEIESRESRLFEYEEKRPVQLHNTYIIQQIKSGILVIEQNAAHERILYERNLEILDSGEVQTQKEMFPKMLHLSKADFTLMLDILDEIRCLGFEIEDFGNESFIIHGIPAHLVGINQDPETLIQNLISEYKQNLELRLGVKENIARSMARKCAVRKGQSLQIEQMSEIIDSLFACATPNTSPFGNKCFFTLDHKELFNRLSK